MLQYTHKGLGTQRPGLKGGLCSPTAEANGRIVHFIIVIQENISVSRGSCFLFLQADKNSKRNLLLRSNQKKPRRFWRLPEHHFFYAPLSVKSMTLKRDCKPGWGGLLIYLLQSPSLPPPLSFLSSELCPSFAETFSAPSFLLGVFSAFSWLLVLFHTHTSPLPFLSSFSTSTLSSVQWQLSVLGIVFMLKDL